MWQGGEKDASALTMFYSVMGFKLINKLALGSMLRFSENGTELITDKGIQSYQAWTRSNALHNFIHFLFHCLMWRRVPEKMQPGKQKTLL